VSRRASPRCLILCPPWPRSGSANLFEAQTRAYLRLGFEVALVVVPHDDALHGPEQRDFWAWVEAQLRFDPRQEVFLNRIDRADAVRPAAGVSALSWQAGVAARSLLAGRLATQLDRRGADVLHVNHCFNLGAAERIAARCVAAGHARPALLLETQDVQADRYRDSEIANPATGRVDARERLARDERSLCEGADLLLHLSEPDLEHFRAALPGKPHRLVRPSLGRVPDAPAPGQRRRAEIDFLYVGDGHRANARSVEWLLTRVASRLDPGVRLRIVGRITDRVRTEDPTLYAAHAGLWGGRPADLRDAYAATRFVVAPVIGGTGVSIKLIEALAMGKRVVTTPDVLPAFRGVEGFERAVEVADGPEAFARAMNHLAAGPAREEEAARAVHARYFADGIHREALAKILGELGRLPPIPF